MDRTKYEIEIKRHAFIRAMERGITPDMIEATLNGGTIQPFGKNYVKIQKSYKQFTVVCVGEIAGIRLKIITIEAKR